MNAITVENLKKTYTTTKIVKLFPPKKIVEKTEALKGISFYVRDGEIFGLLGPNGAGKTTTMLILAGLLLPDDGKAEILGIDVVENINEVRKIVGLITGGNPRQMYNKLTGLENLLYFADLYGVDKRVAYKRALKLLEIVGLKEKAHVLFENYSTGMMQRLAIAKGLIHDPPVLLLDEPTLGLDPKAAKDIRRFIKSTLKEEFGKTILLTSHYMLEVEELSDRVAIINNGRIIATGRPDELKRTVKDEVVELKLLNIHKQPDELLVGIDGIKSVKSELLDGNIGLWRIKIIHDGIDIVKLVNRISKANGVKLNSLNVIEPSLEEVFLLLTSKEVR